MRYFLFIQHDEKESFMNVFYYLLEVSFNGRKVDHKCIRMKLK